MRSCHYLLLLWITASSSFQAHAQLSAYYAQVFGEAHDLGSGYLLDVFADQDGFIWTTTYGGLQRFDGKNVRNYPIPGNVTFALCDAHGRIWAMSGQSIWRNRLERDDFEQIGFDTIGGIQLRGIFQLLGRPLMLLTNKGLYAWQESAAKFEPFNLNIPPVGGRHIITRLDTCYNTLFYSAKEGGVRALDLETGRTNWVHFNFEFDQLYALSPELGVMTAYTLDSYWMDFKTGALRKMDARKYGLSKTSSKMNIKGCAAIGGGRFLINTKYGLCIYDINSDRFEQKPVFAEGKPIDESEDMGRIVLDSRGTAWAITLTKLLAIRPTANALGLLRNPYFEGPNQWDNNIYSMVEGEKGALWLSGMAGFKKLDLNNGKMRVFPNVEGATDRLSHQHVRGIGWDGRYVILGATNKGVWLYDPQTAYYRKPVFTSDSVRLAQEGDFVDYIARMNNGDHLICGRFFLYRIRAQTLQMSFVRFSGDKDNMNFAMQDSQGRVWLGTAKGVICLDAHYHFLFKVETPDQSPVFSIMEHRQGEMLIGTRTGLYRLRENGVQTTLTSVPTPAAGLNVASIYRDKLHRYWLGSHNGLILADSSLKTFKKFDFADNIQSKVYNDGGVLRASNGMLFFAGVNGLNYCYPEQVSMADEPLSVTIQSININDGDTVLHHSIQGLRLPYLHNTLTFEVIAPYFYNTSNVQYRYRLRGQSESWVNMGANNQFRLPDLPPGDYQFEVAASLSGKTWYEATPFMFSIAMPFWKSWWFISMAGLLITGVVLCLIAYRESRLHQRQKEQLELEKLINTNLKYQLEAEQVIHYFTQILGEKNKIDDLLWGVTQGCIARLGWDDCVIYLLDSARQVLVQKAAWGGKSEDGQRIINPMEIPLGRGIVGHVAATGQPCLVPDTSIDTRYIVDDMARGSELAVPILADGQVIGVIDTEHPQKEFYGNWHLQILTAIATFCSGKISLLQVEEMRHEAHRQLEEKQKSLLEVEKRAAQLRLVALTNHLNPHFLFNSLTSLNSLIFENQELASDFLKHLSKVYRYLLQHQEQETVSLKTEMDFLENYIFLLKTRFQNDLHFDLPILKREVLERGIVPVTLQILIENAVKHNIVSRAQPLYVKISIEGDWLLVTNNRQWKKQVITSNQIGLANLIALYQYLSERPITVIKTEDLFIVKLPLLPV